MKRFNVLFGIVPNGKLLAVHRATFTVLIAFLAAAVAVENVEGAVQVAGELVVDLRGVDLQGGLSTWTNRDTTGDTVGDFSTAAATHLNVISGISDGTITVPFALNVSNKAVNALVAATLTPASIIGNHTRSVEAWVYTNSNTGTQSVVGWGTGGNDLQSVFNYNAGSNGMFSGWFNDAAWATVPVINKWTYVAYTYDGTTVRGYRNGFLDQSYAPIDGNTSGVPLDTTNDKISVGADHQAASDSLNGYLADVRVDTGVLSDAQILNNFNAGIYQTTGFACDLDGNGLCNTADANTLQSNLFKTGVSSQGDINRDGFIDWTDWRLFKDDAHRIVGGAGSGATGSAQVPEPTSLSSLAIAAAVLAAAASTRRRASA